MVRRLSQELFYLLLLVFFAVGCTGPRPAPGAVPAPTAVPTLPPTATPVPTPRPTSTPTLTPRPSSTPAPSPTPGPFDLSSDWRRPDPETAPIASFSAINIPSWLVLEEGESVAMAEAAAAYDQLVHPQVALRTVVEESGISITLAIRDFLSAYPDGDGAIPALLMLGHIHDIFYRSDLFDGEELAWEYEEAVRHLLVRHPERLRNLLHDLEDLGLPIVKPQLIRLDDDGPQVLLFNYSSYLWFGETVGRLYTLVQQPDDTWNFAPLPTHYIAGWTYYSRIETVADMNRDGRSEVVAVLSHAYADGPGLVLNVFAWQDGQWVDRLSWNALGRTGEHTDAFYGDFWVEDMEGDGIQEFVVSYYLAPPGGGGDRTLNVYQWDADSQLYVDTMPITTLPCGYHAYAEAERLRFLGDWEAALPWYAEAASRFEAELAGENPACRAHRYNLKDWLEIAKDPSKIDR